MVNRKPHPVPRPEKLGWCCGKRRWCVIKMVFWVNVKPHPVLLKFSCCCLKEIFSSTFWHMGCSHSEVPFSAEAFRDIFPWCWLYVRKKLPLGSPLYVSYSFSLVGAFSDLLLPKLHKRSPTLVCVIPMSIWETFIHKIYDSVLHLVLCELLLNYQWFNLWCEVIMRYKVDERSAERHSTFTNPLIL